MTEVLQCVCSLDVQIEVQIETQAEKLEEAILTMKALYPLV